MAVILRAMAMLEVVLGTILFPPIQFLRGLSITTLTMLSLMLGTAFVARRKGYRIRFTLSAVVLSALPGSRRFPYGVNVRVSTRIIAFLFGGCRGQWLDFSTDRFAMRLRPALAVSDQSLSALGGIRRVFSTLSAALSVDNVYWKTLLHNVFVHVVVFLLRGIRLRAERVRICRQDAHWMIKADQFVYIGNAEGFFGSRYSMSVNDLSLVSHRYPTNSIPPDSRSTDFLDEQNLQESSIAFSRSAKFVHSQPAGNEHDDKRSADIGGSVQCSSKTESSRHCFDNSETPAFGVSSTSPRFIESSGVHAAQSLDDGVPLSESNRQKQSEIAKLSSPLQINLVLRKGVHFDAILTPRLLTILRPRRMAIMDDITFHLDMRDMSLRAREVIFCKVDLFKAVLCPGYSRSLRAKLPPSAPSTRRPRKPGLLRYWECSGNVSGVLARISPPKGQNALNLLRNTTNNAGHCSFHTFHGSSVSDREASRAHAGKSPDNLVADESHGLFGRLHSLSFDAFGMAADERQEAMCKANLSLHQMYFGSVATENAVRVSCEVLAHARPASRGMQSQNRSAEDKSKCAATDCTPDIKLDGTSDETCGCIIQDINDRRSDCTSSGMIDAEENGCGMPPSRNDRSANHACNSCNCRDDKNVQTDQSAGDESNTYGSPNLREAIENIVRLKPEAVLWLNQVSAGFDMNCAKRDAVRVNVNGEGLVSAIEPVGFSHILCQLLAFLALYKKRPENPVSPVTVSPLSPASPVDPPPSMEFFGASRANNATQSSSDLTLSMVDDGGLRRQFSRTTSTSSVSSSGTDGAEKGTALLGCNLRTVCALVLSEDDSNECDSLALVFLAESVHVPRVVRSGAINSGLRMVAELTQIRIEHWDKWAKTVNLRCNSVAFNNIHQSTDERRQITVTGLCLEWDLDFHTALEELPYRIRQLKLELREVACVGHPSSQTSCACPSSFRVRNPPDFMQFTDNISEPMRLKQFASGLSSSIFSRMSSSTASSGNGTTSSGATDVTTLLDADAAALAEIERRERREQRRKRFFKELRSWVFSGTTVSLAVSFPDGPRLAISASHIPEVSLSDQWYKALHVVVSLQERKFVYGCDVQIENPIHSMGRTTERRRIKIIVNSLRGVLWYDFWFGNLLQDWIVRVKAVLKVCREARYKRKQVAMPRYKKKPLPDLHFTFLDCEIFMEDHPLNAFLAKTLPLLQDEAWEREKRDRIFSSSLQVLRQNGTSTDFEQRLLLSRLRAHSDTFISRMKALKRAGEHQVAGGFIPCLNGPPLARLTAASISLNLTMDDATRKQGSVESIRKLRSLDEYLLGPQKLCKTRQYETDAYNDLGFRDIGLDAKGLRLRFRDYPTAFMSIDRFSFTADSIMGLAVQATTAPYLTRAVVAIGRRRVVEIIKSVASTKLFMDVHLVADLMQCSFNPAYMGAIGDFGRAFSRFLGGGRNPSPRLPWFDSMRSNMHGRFRITARKLKGTLSSSTSPYTMTKHFADVEAQDVSMLMSRMSPSENDRHPISWEVFHWHIRPSRFREDTRSLIVLEYVKVGLNPVPQTLSRDAQDHYFLPFASRVDVDRGGLGIGRACMQQSWQDAPVSSALNSAGCYTTWTSPDLETIPCYDSYSDFRTISMHLGVDIRIHHAPNVERPSSSPRSDVRRASFEGNPTKVALKNSHTGASCTNGPQFKRAYGFNEQNCSSSGFWAPRGASIVHSDAISTLIKVVSKLIHRPVSNRISPRWIDRGQRPPCPYGLSYCIMSVDIEAEITDVNVIFYNNMEKGNGLFVSAKQVTGGSSKQSSHLEAEKGHEVIKETNVTRRFVDARDIYCALRLPDLEFVDPETNCGFLFSLSSLQLSCDCHSLPSSRYKCEKYFENVLQSSVSVSACGSALMDSNESASHEISPKKRRLPRVLSSGFGDDDDTSPFYTFSSNHELQRGKRLDKVHYAQILSIDGIIFLWTPKRRNAVISWPSVFKEKTFAMRVSTCRPTLHDISTLEDRNMSALDSSEAGNLNNLRTDDHRGDNIRSKTTSLPLCSDVVNQVVNDPQRQSDGDLYDLLHASSETDDLVLPEPSVGHGELQQRRVTTSKNPGAISEQSHSVGKELNNFNVSSNVGEARDDEKCGDDAENRSAGALVTSKKEILSTNPKFQVMIKDSQICFGSPDTEGLVILTSEAASVGFVDKTVQQIHQCGGSSETWIDAEHRVHLQRSRVYSVSKALSTFDFHKRWVPKEADATEDEEELSRITSSMTRVTTQPISMNLMFIRPRSITKDDDQDDNIVRPSLLFINIPYLSMYSTSTEFHSVIDVVRKVLMQRIPHSDIVKDELATLRYNLQLAGSRLSTWELVEYGRRLNYIVKQFMYAGDTFQDYLVKSLIREQDGDFVANLIRYKAKAAALATYLRSEHRASGAAELYPTMYISYSFDQCSWQLRDLSPRKTPFVELVLTDLVCRHIFYIGRGSSSEFTFRNINAINRLEGGFYRGILHPSGMRHTEGAPNDVSSKIKASDGTAVAFRWSATQMETVGGIPVYDLLTINVAPLNAAISNNVYQAVLEFAFGTSKLKEVVPRAKGSSASSTTNHQTGSVHRANSGSTQIAVDKTIDRSESVSVRSLSPNEVREGGSMRKSDTKRRGHGGVNVPATQPSSQAPLHARSRSQDVEEMDQRGQTTMLFRYIYIGEFQLTASYRKREDPEAHSMLDITDLTVNSPSYMYSSEVWSWRDFARQIRKELLLTFAVRGVTNLAKIKLLPGYQHARHRIKQGTDSVRHGLYERTAGLIALESSSSSSRNSTTSASETDRNDSEESVSKPNRADDRRFVNEADQHCNTATRIYLPGDNAEKRLYVLNVLYGLRRNHTLDTKSSDAGGRVTATKSFSEAEDQRHRSSRTGGLIRNLLHRDRGVQIPEDAQPLLSSGLSRGREPYSQRHAKPPHGQKR